MTGQSRDPSSSRAEPQPLALSGVRVLDFSKVLAGPLCTQYLGDMGADVVKVETVLEGDDSRRFPPFHEAGGEIDGTVYLAVNRNKRSIAIDLKRDEGRAISRKLIASADVVIESFGPGVAARLGVDAASVHAIDPRIIHCGVSGYGNSGPLKEGKGYDNVLQAFSGMLAITGERGGESVRSPFSPVDQATGLHALIGILAGLVQRTRTGRGMAIEASLFDTAVGFLGYILQGFWKTGQEPERPGSSHDSLCPYEVFPTLDKAVLLGVANDSLWRKFCAIAGAPQLADDPRFTTNALRVANRQETVASVRALLATRGRDAWIRACGDAGIPCSPVHTLGEMAAHPHTTASGLLLDYEHPRYGPLHGIAQPLKFDGARLGVRRPPPLFAEHTEEILLEAGYTREAITRLASDRTIAVGDATP
ncbi:MAG TPA: CoA transferase [Casimicrobiaceae bacterium]|nr:CoA transferase [Casimicrobiaceae bacterium]